MQRIQLSNNFYLDEFTLSQTAVRHGIDMTVREGSAVHLDLIRLCKIILQPMRDALGPVNISSGYRPPELNKLIGGSKTSQHRFGQAADFGVVGRSPLAVCVWIAENLSTVFDQVIHEFGRWVHVSIASDGKQPRGEMLTAYKDPDTSKTKYMTGLHEIKFIIGDNS